MSLTPGEVKIQVEKLAAEKKVSPEYLKLFCDLFAAEYKLEQRLLLKDLYPHVSKEEIRRRLADGQPAIETGRLNISETALRRFLLEIGKIMAKYDETGGRIISRLYDASGEGRVSLPDLVKAIIDGDDSFLGSTAEALDIDKEELTFVGVTLARPVMRRLARSVKAKGSFGEEFSDRCPVCGGPPLMARLKEGEGKRTVECAICASEWTVKRIRCLACGNEQNDTLGYIFIENDPRRIDKCEICHAYIKTADERKNAAINSRDLLVEDAGTVYLDMLAEQKGFHAIR